MFSKLQSTIKGCLILKVVGNWMITKMSLQYLQVISSMRIKCIHLTLYILMLLQETKINRRSQLNILALAFLFDVFCSWRMLDFLQKYSQKHKNSWLKLLHLIPDCLCSQNGGCTNNDSLHNSMIEKYLIIKTDNTNLVYFMLNR